MSAKIFLDTNVVLCSAAARATSVLPLSRRRGLRENRDDPPADEAVGLQFKALAGVHPGPVPTFFEVHRDADR
jgi:hypothetical protein